MSIFSKLKGRIQKILSAKYLPIVLAALAMALVSGTLANGIYFDDHIHRLKLETPHLLPPSQYGTLGGLFAFGTGDPELVRHAMEIGTVPWWTYQELKIAFFRPISAMSHWVDYRFWPDKPALMHLQSILWLGAFVFTAAMFYRRIMSPLWVAGLAGLIFAIDDAHGIPAGWLANRNALIAAVWGLCALICHDRWRREGWKAGAVCAPVCFLLGLFSAEAGLGAGAYLVAYELFLVTGKLRKKIMGILPYVMVGTLWYCIYHLWGFGTEGGGGYIDPGQNPLGYLTALFERLPVLLYGQWFFPNAVIYGMLPKAAAHIVLVVVYGILACMAVVLWPIVKRDGEAKFWALGMVLALLPACATTPDNRLLLFSGLGAMGLLARLLAAWSERATWLPSSRVWKGTAHVFAIIFIFVHFIIAPLFLPLQSQGVAQLSDITLEKPLMDLSENDSFRGKTLVFVNPPIPFAVGHIPFVCEQYAIPRPQTTRVLATGLSSDLTITRTDNTSLEIESNGGFITHSFDRLYRGASHPMAVGQRVELTDMTIQVLTLTEDQRPLKVHFTFAKPLEDKSLCFYQWRETGFLPFTLPAVGASVQLTRVNLPLGRK